MTNSPGGFMPVRDHYAKEAKEEPTARSTSCNCRSGAANRQALALLEKLGADLQEIRAQVSALKSDLRGVGLLRGKSESGGGFKPPKDHWVN